MSKTPHIFVLRGFLVLTSLYLQTCDPDDTSNSSDNVCGPCGVRVSKSTTAVTSSSAYGLNDNDAYGSSNNLSDNDAYGSSNNASNDNYDCKPASAGKVCRPAAGLCDEDDKCDGASKECPEDAKKSPRHICREASSNLDKSCDAPEYCDGENDECPPDRPYPLNHICRFPTADEPCAAPDYCNGEDTQCPRNDAIRSESHVCRQAADDEPCDEPEFCDGVSSRCPEDRVKPKGYPCVFSTTPYTTDAVCDGLSKQCPDSDGGVRVGIDSPAGL